MKKLISLLAILIVSYALQSQNVSNPYASIGKKKPKIATVTNGAYDELYIKDSLVLINDNAISRKTGDIVFSKKDNPKIIAELSKKEEDKFRFLSVDPLFGSFPYYTPYQYAGNKPIAAIDLDGAEEFIVVRWYDPMDETKWIGSEVLYVVNKDDRQLGQNGTLYLHLTKSQDNIDMVDKQLSLASRHGTNDANNTSFSAEAQRANIFDANNNLISNPDYIYKSSNPENSHENAAANSTKNIANTPVSKGKWISAISNIVPPTYEIGFDKNSSKYTPLLDNDGNGKDNATEINNAINYLNNNSTTQAVVTGNASLETTTVNNTQLAKDRATTTGKILKSNGIDQNRIVKKERYSSGNSTLENPKNRNATVKPNIPRP